MPAEAPQVQRSPHAEREGTVKHAKALNILIIVLCFALPPLAVGLKKGMGFDLVLNIVLTLLGWLPAVVHALLIVVSNLGTFAFPQERQPATRGEGTTTAVVGTQPTAARTSPEVAAPETLEKQREAYATPYPTAPAKEMRPELGYGAARPQVPGAGPHEAAPPTSPTLAHEVPPSKAHELGPAGPIEGHMQPAYMR